MSFSTLTRDPAKTRDWKQRTATPLQRSAIRRSEQPMRRVSKKQREKQAAFDAAVQIPEGQVCQWPQMDDPEPCGVLARHRHHLRGRDGARLTDASGIAYLCPEHHGWCQGSYRQWSEAKRRGMLLSRLQAGGMTQNTSER